MKKVALVFSVLVLSLIFNQAKAAPMIPASEKLLTCSFVESMSVSYGYSSVYTFSGVITVADPAARDPFYEIDSPATVAIDSTASTNHPAVHVADTTANINNHPWGPKVMLDITSTQTTGNQAFRILVFPGALSDGSFAAYKLDTLTGNGLAGSCTSVEPKLVINE